MALSRPIWSRRWTVHTVKNAATTSAEMTSRNPRMSDMVAVSAAYPGEPANDSFLVSTSTPARSPTFTDASGESLRATDETSPRPEGVVAPGVTCSQVGRSV